MSACDPCGAPDQVEDTAPIVNHGMPQEEEIVEPPKMTEMQEKPFSVVADSNDNKTLKEAPAVVNVAPEPTPAPAPAPQSNGMIYGLTGLLFIVVIVLAVLLGAEKSKNAKDGDVTEIYDTTTSGLFTVNYCDGTNPAFPNFECTEAVANEVEQAGANVTKGYVGLIDNSATPPISTPYYQNGLCPVNVHWHLGAEHLSVGEFDEHGTGPYDPYEKHDDDDHRRLAAGGVRLGFQCRHYDETDSKFTKSFNWKHCVDMKVGQTYEIHWPHSTVGACNTPYQYQTPFYDGVFCNYPSGGATTHDNVGVQSQVFTIVNDETYYYPDLIKGMIVDGDFGADMAIYTGSTTGTSRDNDVCSQYSPITWQVDRKCHLISASSFDKMCADMMAQADDMSDDLYAHGSRELVSKELASTQEVRA